MANEERHERLRGWKFRLYVAGDSPRSLLARSNLERLCEKYLKGDYSIDVVDLLDDPLQATREQIIAVPTLIRLRPEPVRRVIGDLSDEISALDGLDIQRPAKQPFSPKRRESEA